MHRWPPLQRKRIEIRGRIVKSMLSNCSEMLILGTYWKTWYSLVIEQTCTIDHKIDQSLRQTPESIDILHSSHMWIQTILLCGKYCKAMQAGTVSRLRFLREILRTQNLLQVEHCAFSEAIHLFWSVGCVRNKLQFRTVHPNQKSFPWTQDWGCTVYPHLIYEIWSSQFFHGNTNQSNQERRLVHEPSSCKTSQTSNAKEIPKRVINDLDNVDFISSNVHPSRQESLLHIFEDNEAVIEIIIKGRSLPWDMFPELTELLLIGCLIESIWTPRSKSNTLTPKTNSLTY